MTQTAAVRARFDATDIAYIAVFAAVIGVLGLPGGIQIAGSVPITLQTLGVMLAGAVLGPWRGAASVAVLLGAVALGLPLLSGGRGGLAVFAGPTVGYLIGWVAGAAVIGLIVQIGRRRPVWWRTALGVVVGGILVVYAFGIPVQAAMTGLGLGETVITSLAFLPGDAIKVAVAVAATSVLWRAYPRAFRWSERARSA